MSSEGCFRLFFRMLLPIILPNVTSDYSSECSFRRLFPLYIYILHNSFISSFPLIFIYYFYIILFNRHNNFYSLSFSFIPSLNSPFIFIITSLIYFSFKFIYKRNNFIYFHNLIVQQ